MSEERLRAFQEALTADAVVAIAKAAGYVITAEELIEAQAKQLEDELEGVIGGSAQFPTTTKPNGDLEAMCGCGEENCACVSCDSAAPAG